MRRVEQNSLSKGKKKKKRWRSQKSQNKTRWPPRTGTRSCRGRARSCKRTGGAPPGRTCLRTSVREEERERGIEKRERERENEKLCLLVCRFRSTKLLTSNSSPSKCSTLLSPKNTINPPHTQCAASSSSRSGSRREGAAGSRPSFRRRLRWRRSRQTTTRKTVSSPRALKRPLLPPFAPSSLLFQRPIALTRQKGRSGTLPTEPSAER